MKRILKEHKKIKRLSQSPAFWLNSFRNGESFKMGVNIEIVLVKEEVEKEEDLQ
jgi:hypothetical protein